MRTLLLEAEKPSVVSVHQNIHVLEESFVSVLLWTTAEREKANSSVVNLRDKSQSWESSG